MLPRFFPLSVYFSHEIRILWISETILLFYGSSASFLGTYNDFLGPEFSGTFLWFSGTVFWGSRFILLNIRETAVVLWDCPLVLVDPQDVDQWASSMHRAAQWYRTQCASTHKDSPDRPPATSLTCLWCHSSESWTLHLQPSRGLWIYQTWSELP